MSLLRLLAVGKSLIGLGSPTPYKMTEANLLPKFGELPAHSTVSAGQPVKKPSLALSTGFAPAVPIVPATLPARKSNLLFAALANSSAQKSARKLVQAELSLGQIRVVRNDLQDSDLEVVSTKRRQPKIRPARDSQPLEANRTGV